jgi:hypothetical protein
MVGGWRSVAATCDSGALWRRFWSCASRLGGAELAGQALLVWRGVAELELAGQRSWSAMKATVTKALNIRSVLS